MIKYEQKTYSQNGEDGIIKHIFDNIGTTNKIAVEIGVTDEVSKNSHYNLECNTRLLSEQGWKTYLFDGLIPPYIPQNATFIKKFLTSTNVVETFQQLNIPEEFDLLSIDIDGNDYWIRESLSLYSPRVCVLEYNGCYPGNAGYIMPYDENYSWKLWESNFGASLKSFTEQADRLGYDLVYCESKGVNAFFVRKDANVFPKKTSEEAWVKLWWYQQ